MICLIDNLYIYIYIYIYIYMIYLYYCMDRIYTQKRSLRNYTENSKYELFTER
jgi:hypothetical protein